MSCRTKPGGDPGPDPGLRERPSTVGRGAAVLLLPLLWCGACDAGEPAREDSDGQPGITAADAAGPDTGSVRRQTDTAAADADPTLTLDALLGALGCQTDADCAALVGGNLCHGKPFCDTSRTPARCGLEPGSAVVCSAAKATQCVDQVCNPYNGECQPVAKPELTACNDGDPCTVQSACEKGTCKGSDESWCQCQEAADCAAFEDGNACTGTLYCAKSVFPPKCKVNPATVTACPTSGDTACRANSCDPDTGACALKNAPDKTACDDGDPTTHGDLCQKGVCQPGIETAPCTKNADCVDDGDLCNGVPYCHLTTKKCVPNNPATTVTCPTYADTACLASTCLPATGACQLLPTNEGKDCKDGDPCTQGERCKKGACVAQKDLFLCGCKADGDCKDDGNACNGLPYCNQATKKCDVDYSKVVVCQAVADTQCTKNACLPMSGACTATAVEDARLRPCPTVNGPVPNCRWERRGDKESPTENVLCNDANPCTVGETCHASACQKGEKVCECTTNADCAKKDDGNLCNGVFYCDKTKAKAVCRFNPAAKVYCTPVPGAPCLHEVCDPVTGTCNPKPKGTGATCDDGKQCTLADACVLGATGTSTCVGKLDACSDGNPCTTDACIEGQGCAHKAVGCNDGNSCTLDRCDKTTGQCDFSKPVPDGLVCNADNSGCTVNDRCAAGVCKVGTAVTCTAKTGPCEVAACASTGPTSSTCAVTKREDGAACDDGDPCRLGETCQAGQCKAGAQQTLHTADDALTPGGSRLSAVTVVADGGTVAAGAVYREKWLGGRPLGIRIVGFDPGGGVRSARLDPVEVTPTTAQQDDVGAVAVLPTVTGGTLTIGTTVDQAGRLRIRTIALSADGKLNGAVTMGVAGTDEQALAAVAGIGGGAVIGGVRTAGDSDGLALALSPGSAPIWTFVRGTKGKPDAFHGVSMRSDGRVLLAGRGAAADGVDAGWLVALSAQGKMLWERHPRVTLPTGKPAAQQRLTVVSWTANGALALGWSEQAGKRLLWQVGTDANGVMRWNKPGFRQVELAHLVRRSGDRIVVAGTSHPSATASDTRVMALDAAGNIEWEITRDLSPFESAGGIAADPQSGALAVVGARDNGKARRGWIMRLDPWGRGSCSSAGKCATTALSACEDKAFCTQDACSPTKGCVHTTPASRACFAADSCSQSGQCAGATCKPAVAGRLFDETQPADKLKEVIQVVPDGQGTFIAARRVDGTLDLVRLDRFGQLTGKQHLAVSDAVHIAGAVPVWDGGAIVGYRHKDGSTRARRTGPDGKIVWTSTLCKPNPMTWWPRLGQHFRVDLATTYWKAWHNTCRLDAMQMAPSGAHVLFSGVTAAYRNKGVGQGISGKIITRLHTRKSCIRWAARAVSDGAVAAVHGGGPVCGGYVLTCRGYPSCGWLKQLLLQQPMYVAGRASGLADGGTALVTRCRAFDLKGSHHSSYYRPTDQRVRFDRRHKDGAADFVWGKTVGEHDRLPAFTETLDGGYVLAGHRLVAGVSKDWLVRIDAKGKELWAATGAYSGQRRVHAIVQRPDTTLAALHNTLLPGATRLRGVLTDATGKLLVERPIGPAGGVVTVPTMYPARALADGGMVIAASVAALGKSAIVAVRADAWGHTTCAAAGKCAGKKLADCGDGKACSADLCSAATGCEAKPKGCKD